MVRLYFVITLFVSNIVFSQTFLETSNTTLYIANGTDLYVNGDVIAESASVFNNTGSFHISGDFINNSSANLMIDNAIGLVDLIGNNQNIGGIYQTTFNRLKFSGTGVKNMLTSSEVKDSLNLVDAELQTNDNVMLLSNTDSASLSWNLGYVASNTNGGYLMRSMNGTQEYWYPVGSSLLSNNYRAVSIKSSTIDSCVYGVRLADVDPSFDFTGTSFTGATGGFDVNVKSDMVSGVNTDFYHNIARVHGSDPANVKMYYFSSDGDYQSMAQWQDASNMWENTEFQNSILNSGSFWDIGNPDMVSESIIQNDFSHDIFALSNVFGVEIPQFISPNNDGRNDFLIIENIKFYPNSVLKIFNRYGNIVYEKKGYINDWSGEINAGQNIFSYANGMLVPGTYFYALDLGIDEIKPYTGYIHLKK